MTFTVPPDPWYRAVLRAHQACACLVHQHCVVRTVRRSQRLAQVVAEPLPPVPWITALALLSGDRLKVVEVNPALGPRELTEPRQL